MIFPAGKYKIVGLGKKDLLLSDGDLIEVDRLFAIVHSRACRNFEGDKAVLLNLFVEENAVVRINGRRYDEESTE